MHRVEEIYILEKVKTIPRKELTIKDVEMIYNLIKQVRRCNPSQGIDFLYEMSCMESSYKY